MRLSIALLPSAQKRYPAGTSNSTNVRLTEAEVRAVSMVCRRQGVRREAGSERLEENHRVHCGFPQIKIVCQQIRGHSVRLECFSTPRPASSPALGGLIHKLTNTL